MTPATTTEALRSRTVTEKFERATADLEKASNVAIGRAEAMGQISDNVIQKIDTVGVRVREHAEQLANSASRAITAMSRPRSSFKASVMMMISVLSPT